MAFDGIARDTGRAVLAGLLDAVGIVDAMWSLAAVTAERGWTYPRPSSRLAVEGLSNAFLEAGHGIANDLRLDDCTRVCVVTGPNMAGKSTFLRAIAIAVLLAHAGCGVPAVAMEFPTVATIFSSVQITDDLAAGESFYLAEVRRIRALAVALHEHRSMLAVLDEPFRGTNVHDATEASLGVISRLVAHPGALVFVATHLAEVATALRDDPRVQFLCFSADLAGDRPVFDYRLRDGVSTQRLGMTLLRQERVLELLEPPDDAMLRRRRRLSDGVILRRLRPARRPHAGHQAPEGERSHRRHDERGEAEVDVALDRVEHLVHETGVRLAEG